MKTVIKRYKISINIGNYNYYGTTKTLRLPRVFFPYLFGYIISIITVFLGFGGYRIFRQQKQGILNSIQALSINLSGGEDLTETIQQKKYDDITNFVWNNLLRKTTDKISLDEVDFILKIQEKFMELNKNNMYTDENIDFIIMHLAKRDIHRIRKPEIMDIFDALKSYENNLINNDIVIH